MEKNRSRIPALVGLVFSGAGILLAALLVCKHVFPGLCSSSLGCDIQGVDGCSSLGKNPASKLFGVIPFAIPGFFYYVYVFSLFLGIYREENRSRRTGLIQVTLTVATFGFVLDMFLAYVNFFQLPVPCLLCAYSYIATIGLASASFYAYSAEGRTGSEGEPVSFVSSLLRTLPGAAVALVATILLIGALAMVSPGKSMDSPMSGSIYLPEDEADGLLKDFRALKTVDLDTRGLQSVEGSDEAYIEIQKFADFRCPHCYHAGEILKEAMKRWPGRIRIYYRHFPLDGTCNRLVGRVQEGAWSCNGAQAALCAPDQKIFAPFYHRLFDFQVENKMITLGELQKLTESLGGNWSRMLECMGSQKTAAALERDLKDAEKLSINATPTLVVNGHILPSGTPDREFFLHLMDALVLEKEGKTAYEKVIQGERK